MNSGGVLAYTMSLGSVDFVLNNILATDDYVQWVYWWRGITRQQILNKLDQVRVIVIWNGNNYTYDFTSSSYCLLVDHGEEGWVTPNTCVDQSGGIMASIRVKRDQQCDSEAGDQRNPDLLTLRDLVLESKIPLFLEVRSRATTHADWCTRLLRLQTRISKEPEAIIRLDSGCVAFAA